MIEAELERRFQSMQKVDEIFGFLSPKQLMTLDNKTLREKATTLTNLYRDDLDKEELSVQMESFKYSVVDSKQNRSRWPSGMVSALGSKGFQVRNPILPKIRHVLGLLYFKSYVARLPAVVVRKFGEGAAQVSSSSSDRGSKLRGLS
ncbi:hypothetical protein AVEN_243863-1 [Araneus ventricosus]|uniref:Uncharacterized protein n=1 Tax=Araneus ventricosus TaxID=182803 RepID=A0A4Y2A6N4_ARAVE|nr:hypothetical protein AVEN_243863-1 [Araneus ventricosus]